MRSYPLNEARAEFSKVVERALAGEPQRITRYGKEAVIVVAESTWREHQRRAATLGDLLAKFAEAEGGEEELFSERPFVQAKSLGSDFVGDE
jgi:prevent-host-death family protein